MLLAVVGKVVAKVIRGSCTSWQKRGYPSRTVGLGRVEAGVCSEAVDGEVL